MMNISPYFLGTDPSNDEGSLKKLNPILVCLFDSEKGKVRSQLLGMGACKEASANALFQNINCVLLQSKVSRNNCLALGVDSTAVNMGKRNSIMTHALQQSKNIFTNRCPCHIIHNTANKGPKALSKISKFEIEDFLVDIFHWFEKCSKRKV